MKEMKGVLKELKSQPMFEDVSKRNNYWIQCVHRIERRGVRNLMDGGTENFL
jgi:hypothetical protein